MRVRVGCALIAAAFSVAWLIGGLSKPVTASAAASGTPVYRGAWFDISYPARFQVAPGPRSATSTTGADSATFTSPDGSVAFYVYSPQWSGACAYARVDPRAEAVVSSSLQARVNKLPNGRTLDTNTVHWVTVRARNGSYLRSWQDSRNKDLNCRYVVGVRYKSPAALARYKAQYAAFKKSLHQFAD